MENIIALSNFDDTDNFMFTILLINKETNQTIFKKTVPIYYNVQLDTGEILTFVNSSCHKSYNAYNKNNFVKFIDDLTNGRQCTLYFNNVNGVDKFEYDSDNNQLMVTYGMYGDINELIISCDDDFKESIKMSIGDVVNHIDKLEKSSKKY